MAEYMNEETERLSKELKLEAFQYKALLNARSLIIHLEKESIPQEDFLAYMVKKMKVNDPGAIRAAGLTQLLCPICEGSMGLFEVNTMPGTMTGDPTDKSVWLCQNEQCMETIYNKETIEEIRAKKE